MKKAPGSIFNPTMKYTTSEKWETWNSKMGMSVTICAIQKAAGWYKANSACLAKTGRPENESVTSDIARRALKRRARNRAPDLTKRPEELLGAL